MKMSVARRAMSAALVLVLLLFSQNIAVVAALSQDQKDSLKSGARYFNTEEDGVTCSPASSTTPSQGGSVYFVGDSLTVGMRNSGELAQKVVSSGRQVARIQATVGDTVGDALPKVRSDASVIASASIAVVALGTNPGSNQTASGPSFTPQINEIISAIKSANSDVTIYWMNAYKDGDANAYSSINTAIANQSSALGYRVIDWNSEARNNNSEYAPFDSALRIHPGNYSALADFVVSSLGSSAGGTGSTVTCACYGGGSGGDINPSEGARTTWDYFRDAGLSAVATAAIMGNFSQEDSFNPKALQGGGESETVPLDGTTGYGIAQWTYITRQQNLDRFARDQGRLVYDIMLQLDFAYHEMTDNSPSDVWDRMLTFTRSDQIEQATRYFHTNFEGSADEEEGIRQRIDDAIKYLDLYGSGGGGGTGGGPQCPGGGPITPPSGSGQQLALSLLEKHYRGTINGHTYNGDGQLTCQSLNCQDLDNTAHGVSILNNGGPCGANALGQDLMQYLTIVIEQGGFAIGISSLCNDHGRGSSTGSSRSRHNYGEGVDINFVNKVWLCELSSEIHVYNLLRFTNGMIGTPQAPDQLLSQGVGAGSGCSRASNYIARLDALSMNNNQSAPNYTSRFVGDHENHVHVGY